MKRILLDEKDFEQLTKGEIVKKDDVEIALSDIGYYDMFDILETNRTVLREKHSLKDPDNKAYMDKLRNNISRLKSK